MKRIAYLIVLLVAAKALAQGATPIEKRVPFVFLNQYFSYNMLDANRIIISEKTINFGIISIDQNKKIAEIDMSQLSQLKLLPAQIVIKAADASVVAKKVLTSTEVASKKFSLPTKAASVCITAENTFTTLSVCKSLTADLHRTIGVVIDGQKVENKSFVILKEAAKPIAFEANLSPENSVHLTTRKRVFYPKVVKKEVSKPVLAVSFVDTGLTAKEGSWSDEINIEQSSIQIPKDSILTLKQDLFFTNSDILNIGVNYAAGDIPVKPEPKSKPVYKKPEVYIDPNFQYIFEPFTVFAGYKGSASTIDASLASDLGKGVRFTYVKKLDKESSLVARLFAYQLNISSDVNLTTINNSSQLLYGATLGWRHMLTTSVGVTPQVELQQDIFFNNLIGSSQIDIVSGLNKQVSVNPFWIFYSNGLSQASLDLGLTYITSTSASGLSVKSGYKYKFGATYQYRFPQGALILNVESGSRKQDFEDITYSESFLIMSAGYSFYFQ